MRVVNEEKEEELEEREAVREREGNGGERRRGGVGEEMGKERVDAKRKMRCER